MENSMFWDAELVDGKWDREYSSSDFARVFSCFWGDGIVNNNSAPLAVKPIENSLSYRVEPGVAIIGGRVYENTEPLNVQISMGDAEGRVDLIVCRLNAYQRTINITVHQGEKGQGGTSRVWNDSVKELVLAKVTVPENALSVGECSVLDMRGTDVCPWVNATFDIAALQNQFNDWFNNLRDTLTEEAEINLQNQITELKNRHDQEVKELREEVALSGGAVIKGSRIYLRTREYDPEIDTDIP